MRVLILHNEYQFRGGEDTAVAADRELLTAHGHEAMIHIRSYDEIGAGGPLTRPGIAAGLAWSRGSYTRIRDLVRDWQPDIAHFHNIFPLISPSAYHACQSEGVPVVQTLHNYRLVCPAGTLLRDGKVCELCVGRMPWPAIRYACYRGSHTQSLMMAGAIGGHRAAGTWRHEVDAYIALTRFARDIFVRGGLPEARVFIRTNAVGNVPQLAYPGPSSAVFVGRLSPEKGIRTLLAAWEFLPEVRLTIVGDGPLLGYVRDAVAKQHLEHVEVTGGLPHADVVQRIARAGMLIFPSIWYEGLPYTVLEALAAGRPVVSTDIGAQAEIVTDGINGLQFRAGDAESLAAAVRRLNSSPELARQLADGAWRVFQDRYAPDRSYAQLMDVYRRVHARRAGGAA